MMKGLRSSTLRQFLAAVLVCGIAAAMSGCRGFGPGASSTPPAPVTGVAASDGTHSDRIIVSWSPSAGATSYMVYRGIAAGGPFSLQATVEQATLWENVGLEIGVRHWYAIAACNAAGCSAQSAADEGHTAAVVPATPTGVSATDGTSPTVITLTWNPVPGATEYRVYRTDTPGGTYILRATAQRAPWDDEGLTAGVRHWYKVSACNSAGCSDRSAADEGRTGIAAPAAPAWISASDGTVVDRIIVTWSVTAGATAYSVYRAPTYDGEYVAIASVTTGTSYEDAGLGSDVRFWYRVAACNSVGCGPRSVHDEGSTAIAIPETPQNVTATDGTLSMRIDVVWEAVAGATSYQIFRSTPPNASFFFRDSVLGGAVVQWTDRDVTPGVVYRYRVSACNEAGCGPASADDGGSAIP